jgi:hypothetical protein
VLQGEVEDRGSPRALEETICQPAAGLEGPRTIRVPGRKLRRRGGALATFDCYGTLIDWDRGIRDALAALWPGADRTALLAAYQAQCSKLRPAAR